MHLACTYRARDKIGHLYGHVTLTYKVTRQCHISGLHAIDFLDQKNFRNEKKIFALSRLLPELVEWWNSQCLGRHDMTSWECHDITAWLETVTGFLQSRLVLSRKKIKFKIYWKVLHWWWCHFMPWRHTLTSCHDVMSWHFNLQSYLEWREYKNEQLLKSWRWNLKNWRNGTKNKNSGVKKDPSWSFKDYVLKNLWIFSDRIHYYVFLVNGFWKYLHWQRCFWRRIIIMIIIGHYLRAVTWPKPKAMALYKWLYKVIQSVIFQFWKSFKF